MENDSSSDQLRHHAPAGGRGWERHVEVKSEGVKSENLGVHETERLQDLSVRLCGAAHREQYRARGVSGHRD